MLDISLFLLGLNVNADSGDAPPAWLPSWADSGVSYVDNEAYFNDTLITDLSTIHGAGVQGGVFDPTAVTASGMAILTGNTNRPCATGAFLDRLTDLDFMFMAHFDTSADTPVGAVGVIMLINDPNTGDGVAVEWGGGTANMNVADFQNGQFNTVGNLTINAEFKLAGSNTASGWLSSLNGAAAVLDSPQSTIPITQCTIGYEDPITPHSISETHFRGIFFGPVTTVAVDIEARAAL